MFMQDDGSVKQMYRASDGSMFSDCDACEDVAQEQPPRGSLANWRARRPSSGEVKPMQACEICQISFPSKNAMFRHLRCTHGLEPQQKPEKPKASWADLVEEEDAERIRGGRQAVRVVQLAEDLDVVKKFMNAKVDIAEAHSPPRITAEAKKAGMVSGFALDLTVAGPDGKPWDFTKKSCRQRAWRLLKEQRPYMLIGSPPCTAFSIIQNLNMRTPQGKRKVLAARRQAEVHLRFCVAMCREQLRGGRYFVHEHPLTAKSWEVPCVNALSRTPRVYLVKADMCQFGMKSRDAEGEGWAKKPTTFMTNSLEMFKTLSKRCTPGTHRHVPLMEGRAKAAALYPKGICQAVLRRNRAASASGQRKFGEHGVRQP